MLDSSDFSLAPSRARSVRGSASSWFGSSEPAVWLTSATIAILLIAIFGLLGLIAIRGLTYFWVTPVYTIEYVDASDERKLVFGRVVERLDVEPENIGERSATEFNSTSEPHQSWLIKTGNKHANPPDYRWVDSRSVLSKTLNTQVLVIERTSRGDAYGLLHEIYQDGARIESDDYWAELQSRMQRVKRLNEQVEQQLAHRINAVDLELERLRLEARRRDMNSRDDFGDIESKRQSLEDEYAILQDELERLNRQLSRDEMRLRIADGRIISIPLRDVIRAWQPNSMSSVERLTHYVESVWLFLSDNPRESNTEGGVYPALFGTVLMVILMSIFVTPVGVVAALYLREYAKQGPLVRMIRMAVVNLAGVPSIVYGVFGLGLFVYVLGGSIDSLLYSDSQPEPTFGTPGLLWAALTLALLTVPVVIITTEQGLDRVPESIREGSAALGATKAETILKIVLPMASPSILTGMILAVARAAGEVAPLILVGVVKLAPSLPVDGYFPYLHLERKFMHLGFHIYDLAFQSPNVHAAKPLLFATALLLILIVVVLNLLAIVTRNRLESKYEEAIT